MISFPTYALYAYAIFPFCSWSVAFLYSKRYKICPLIKCVRPLAKCLKQDACMVVLECLTECDKEHSEARLQAQRDFSHVFFPNDPSLCRYQCFDQITTMTAEYFLNCVGGSGCLEPSPPEFAIPPAPNNITNVLPFDTIESVLAGKWMKLYTSGWDIWPCQKSQFHPPHSSEPLPEAYMQSWPHEPNVWRMDLRWKLHQDSNYTFHMSNEFYPGRQWKGFAGQPQDAIATLKTRAVMWGTEAHENWYLLDYNADLQTMLVYYSAFTEAVQKMDNIVMVLRKEGSGPFTKEMAATIEQTARNALGDRFGKLYRIKDCNQTS